MDLPICDACGEPVVATLCGTNPSSPASKIAIAAVLVAAHKRLAHECPHLSSTGVDQAPSGDGKVWECDACGWRHRSVRQADGSHLMVPAGLAVGGFVSADDAPVWGERGRVIC